MADRLPLGRRLAFTAGLLVGLLAVTEVALRLLGVQANADRRVSWCREHAPPEPPYFPVLQVDGVDYRAPRIEAQPHPWPADKAPGTRRIVALGGSAVHGYGFTRAGAWPDLLEERLTGAWSDTPVEVLNLGTIAWSAQQLLELTTHVLAELEPDAIVLASGNNELLEWLGARRYLPEPALTRWVWGVTWSRRLRHTATYSAAADALAGGPGVWGQTDYSDDVQLDPHDQAVLGEQGRAFAARNYRHDVRRIVELADDQGVPVVIVAPPVNLAYRPADPPSPEPEASRSLRAQAGRDLLDDPTVVPPDDAIPTAVAAWEWAEALRDQGLPRAQDWYWRALSMDPSPNRALPRVRAIALATPAAATIDGHAVVAELSADGVVDYDLVFDHCHPTPDAHAALAQAIAVALVTQVFPGGAVQTPPPADGVDAWLRMGQDYVRDPATERAQWLEQVRAAPTTPDDLLLLGTVTWHTTDGHCPSGRTPCLQEGFDALRQAVALDPTHCESWAALGRMGAAIDHPDTERWLTTAVACDPTDARSAWRLASR